MKQRMIAWVRQQGAIGVFYPMTFIVEATDAGPAGDLIAQHGEAWELHHIEMASIQRETNREHTKP